MTREGRNSNFSTPRNDHHDQGDEDPQTGSWAHLPGNADQLEGTSPRTVHGNWTWKYKFNKSTCYWALALSQVLYEGLYVVQPT